MTTHFQTKSIKIVVLKNTADHTKSVTKNKLIYKMLYKNFNLTLLCFFATSIIEEIFMIKQKPKNETVKRLAPNFKTIIKITTKTIAGRQIRLFLKKNCAFLKIILIKKKR